MNEAAIYFGHVMHCRLRPFRHRFVYRVFSVFVNIGCMEAISSRCRLFSYNRFNLFSLLDSDHGAADGTRLRPWIDAQLQQADIFLPPASRVFMLCFPRILGYVFNPLTVFFCFGPEQRLRALIYEVRNTFGEKYPYVVAIDDHLAEADLTDGLFTHLQQKQFYVSPFINMDMLYRFRIRAPGERLSVMIREAAPEGELLIATLTGTRRAFNDSTLIKAFFLYPLMSLKVIAAIHFEAFRLWRKGAEPAPRVNATGS